MLSFPSPDSKEPIKNNILYLFWRGYNLDLDILYRTLCNMREMPTGKDKYRGIERALRQLQKEGWPIHMEPDGNGITWYSAGEGFDSRLKESMQNFLEVLKHVKRSMDYAKRYDVQIREVQKTYPDAKISLKGPEIFVGRDKVWVPLKFVPHYVEPLKKEKKE